MVDCTVLSGVMILRRVGSLDSLKHGVSGRYNALLGLDPIEARGVLAEILALAAAAGVAASYPTVAAGTGKGVMSRRNGFSSSSLLLCE